jgi:putative sterol carrier protein
MQGGEIDAGAGYLAQELDGLYEQMGKPIVITEFGADTIAGMHSDPPEMWTEEYQTEFLRAYLDVAAERPFVAGLHVWNFADFKTGQNARRAGGLNLKGVFTRDRRPKMAAHMLRERWTAAASATAAAQPAAAHAEPQMPAPLRQALDRIAEQLTARAPQAEATIGLDVEGHPPYVLLIRGGVARIESRDGGTPDATLRASAETIAKLSAGKLNPMIAFTTGQIKVDGDVRALMVLGGL